MHVKLHLGMEGADFEARKQLVLAGLPTTSTCKRSIEGALIRIDRALDFGDGKPLRFSWQTCPEPFPVSRIFLRWPSTDPSSPYLLYEAWHQQE